MSQSQAVEDGGREVRDCGRLEVAKRQSQQASRDLVPCKRRDKVGMRTRLWREFVAIVLKRLISPSSNLCPSFVALSVRG